MSILSSPISNTVSKTLEGTVEKYDHQIFLIDHTKPQNEATQEQPAQVTDEEEDQDDDLQAATRPLTKKWTAGSLRERTTGQLKHELTRRKYAKYQEGRESEPSTKPESSNTGTFVTAAEQPPLPAESAQRDAEQQASRVGKPLYRRGREQISQGKKQITQLVKGKRAARRGPDADIVIDILYENERGSFLFGVPLFSHNSLLQFDPPAWQTCDPVDQNDRSQTSSHQPSSPVTAQLIDSPNRKTHNAKGSTKNTKPSTRKNAHQPLLRPSPVNITNAQVPDPCWEWAWPSWYVDMAHDVDEEGWEYSFSFGTPPYKSYGWHGAQKPWWHAFVRRRRWIRMRRRKHAHRRDGSLLGGQAGARGEREAHRAHLLNAEYFTIHPAKDSSEAGSVAQTSATGQMFPRHEEDEEDEEIADIGALIKRLKKVAVDREKISAVKRFLKDGGDEVYYLAEYMPHIMSLLIFQSSRRHLLALLSHAIASASHHRTTQHAPSPSPSPPPPQSSTSPKSTTSLKSPRSPPSRLSPPPSAPFGPESPTETRYIDALLRAATAAEHELRRLDYWSDIKATVRDGDGNGLLSSSPADWGVAWRGLDSPVGGPEKAGKRAFESKEKGEPAGAEIDPEGEGREAWEVAVEGFHGTGAGEGGVEEEKESQEREKRNEKGKGKA
ncbi:MAG: hypothetical protein M1821_002846 [Bathelium mastoideum]|nr:MAG: hypothetical protein M1821_002846 [Bathelium mastoideum]